MRRSIALEPASSKSFLVYTILLLKSRFDGGATPSLDEQPRFTHHDFYPESFVLVYWRRCETRLHHVVPLLRRPRAMSSVGDSKAPERIAFQVRYQCMHI